jgi:molecular chaperone GrpE
MSEKQENQESVESTVDAAEQAVEEVVETEATEEIVDENAAKLAELEAKIADEEAKYLRLRADYDNLLRRSRLDLQNAEKYRAQKLLTELLPVLDNLDRALQAESGNEETALFKGVEMVYRQLVDATAKEGLEVIAAEGVQFDPNVHQAVMQEQDAEKESGIIIRELQKGYVLKDRVLRPSMVSVNE